MPPLLSTVDKLFALLPPFKHMQAFSFNSQGLPPDFHELYFRLLNTTLFDRTPALNLTLVPLS
jgi:hypothetical protein